MDFQTHLFFAIKTNKRLDELERQVSDLIQENKALKQSLLELKEDVVNTIIHKKCELCCKQTYNNINYNGLEICSSCYDKLQGNFL